SAPGTLIGTVQYKSSGRSPSGPRLRRAEWPTPGPQPTVSKPTLRVATHPLTLNDRGSRESHSQSGAKITSAVSCPLDSCVIKTPLASTYLHLVSRDGGCRKSGSVPSARPSRQSQGTTKEHPR